MNRFVVENKDLEDSQKLQQIQKILEFDEKMIKIHPFRWAVRQDWQGLAYMIIS